MNFGGRMATTGAGVQHNNKREDLMVLAFLNWRRARMTACLIAIMTVVRPAQSQETKPAEPNVAAANRAVQSQLPFGDRQDFEDALLGFIATPPYPPNPDRCPFFGHTSP